MTDFIDMVLKELEAMSPEALKKSIAVHRKDPLHAILKGIEWGVPALSVRQHFRLDAKLEALIDSLNDLSFEDFDAAVSAANDERFALAA